MSKALKLVLVAASVILIAGAVFGGWYVHKTHTCVNSMVYVPPREGKDVGDGFYGAMNSVDKGDYYILGAQKFKTSEDTIRACRWQ